MILKVKDLVEKTSKELESELASLRKQLFEAKMAFHSRKLENTSTLKQMKKSIARIQTILQEKTTEEATK
jgi:large subunit ribosomal protein L29